jgi:hypothetical protein
MNACKRPHLAVEAIRDQRQSKRREAVRIVIGVEHDLRDLRREALDDMGKQRPSAKR